MRTGARNEDVIDVTQGIYTTQRLSILGNKTQQLIQQFSKRYHFTLSQINHAGVIGVAHCPPAIFIDQHAGITSPALVTAPQAVQHAHQAHC